MIKITNTTTVDLTDRYDGQDYTFPVGKTVRCPLEVAKHFFGIGDPNKLPYLARQGWARTSQEFAAGMEILGKFKFEMLAQESQDDLALNQQGAAPLQQAADDEGGADDPLEVSAATPHQARPDGIGKRNILSRLSPTA